MIRNAFMSHTALMRMQYSYNRKQVLYLTGMSDEALNRLQFSMGLQWLEQYTDSPDNAMLQWILKQPIVWKWWLNEWNRRDSEYLDILYRIYEWRPDEVTDRYKAFHFSCFVKMTYPWRLLEDGYAKSMGELCADKNDAV